MPCRSVSRLRRFSVSLGLFLLLAGAGAGRDARAAVTVVPVAPYGINATGTVFYAGTTTGSGLNANGFMDSGFTFFNLGVSAATDSASRPNQFLFDVRSDKTF